MTIRQTSAMMAAALTAAGASAQGLAPVPHEHARPPAQYVPALPNGPVPDAPVPHYVPALPPQGYPPAPPVLRHPGYAPAPQTYVVPQPPAVRYVPAVPVAPVVQLAPAQRVLTYAEARTALVGMRPGRQEVHFLHPVTNCPVCVKLKPTGCVTEVQCKTFFGQPRLLLKVRGLLNDIVIKFRKDGTVDVDD